MLVDELVRNGVREVVLCPGSRSAPLAYAVLAAERAGRLRLHVRVDERSAGFLALGLARGSGAPVVVMTTSGTAVANLHPAVLEAHHAGVPLVVVSADRPHELRGTGANQTTAQPGIFGASTRYAVDLPAPVVRTGPRPVLAQHRLPRARGRHRRHRRPVGAGPPQRLPARATGPRARGRLRRRVGQPSTSRRTTRGRMPSRAGTTASRGWGWARAGRGPRKRPRSPRWRERWSSSASPATPHSGSVPSPGRPSAATPSWPNRSAAACVRAEAVPHGPLLLTATDWLDAHAPDRVVVVGRPTLSRAVGALLRRPGLCVEVVSEGGQWSDPSHVASAVHPPHALRLGGPTTPGDDHGWSASWRAAGETHRGCRCRATVPVAEWPRGRKRRRRRAPRGRRARPRLEQPRA